MLSYAGSFGIVSYYLYHCVNINDQGSRTCKRSFTYCYRSYLALDGWTRPYQNLFISSSNSLTSQRVRKIYFTRPSIMIVTQP